MTLIIAEILGILLVLAWASYTWTRSVVERTVSESTLLTLSQVDRNYAAMLDAAHDISLFLIANRNVRNYFNTDEPASPAAIQMLRDLNDDIANLVTSKSFILSINLYGNNGSSYESAGPSTSVATGLSSPSVPASGNSVLSATYTRNYQTLGSKHVISFFRRFRDPNNLSKTLGTMRIDIDEAALRAVNADIAEGSDSYVLIADSKGRVLSHPDSARLAGTIAGTKLFAPAFAGRSGYYRAPVDGVDMLVTHYSSPRGVFVSVRPFQDLVRDAGESEWFTLVLFLGAALVACAIAYWIARNITTPIHRLAEAVRRVREGDLDVAVGIARNDEVGALSRDFNSMTAHLRTLIHEVYTSEIAKKEADLRALQAQIDPHFLYNTLDMIYWTARTEGAQKASQAISALSKLFKLGLNRGEEMTTVAQEVEHLKSYLVIQNMRYDSAPEIVIEASDEALLCLTPKLVLQPLVENALLHGVAEMDGTVSKARVGICAEIRQGDLCMTVSDNGTGMDAGTIANVLHPDFGKPAGYGLRNVDQTVKLVFGENFGVRIRSAPGQGTDIEVRMPRRLRPSESTTHAESFAEAKS